MRITNKVMINRAMRNVNSAFQRYQASQEQAGSGRAINRLSDDPHGAARAVRLRSIMRGVDQYKKNVDSASTQVTAYDDNLDKIGSILNRIRELVGRGGTSTMTTGERQALAVEVGQLFEEVVMSANAVHEGDYMFAGHKTGTVPFVVEKDPVTGEVSVAYYGDSGKRMVEVGTGLELITNLNGDEVFKGGPDSPDLFRVLLDVKKHLETDDVDSLSGKDLADIDKAVETILKFRSELGGKATRLELVSNRLDSDKVTLTGFLSQTEDVDFAESMMRLAEHEIAYSAALAAASRSVQSGLLQYLQ